MCTNHRVQVQLALHLQVVLLSRLHSEFGHMCLYVFVGVKQVYTTILSFSVKRAKP